MKIIVIGCVDGKIMTWDSETCECIHTLEGHTNCVKSVCFSPDGSRIVSTSDDRNIKIWNSETGEYLHTLINCSFYITSSSFFINPIGSYI